MNKYSIIQGLVQSIMIYKILKGRNIHQFNVYFKHLEINNQQFKVMSKK